MRWVHVASDGCEEDFTEPPADRKHLHVTFIDRGVDWADETTLILDSTDGEPKPPPGRGWMICGRRKSSTRWCRREK
jgi:hypothetical protein